MRYHSLITLYIPPDLVYSGGSLLVYTPRYFPFTNIGYLASHCLGCIQPFVGRSLAIIRNHIKLMKENKVHWTLIDGLMMSPRLKMQMTIKTGQGPP